MPILQTNQWICDICNHTSTKTQEVNMYETSYAMAPNAEDWQEKLVNDEYKLHCSKCVDKYYEEKLDETSN